jgi:hypothetical protein
LDIAARLATGIERNFHPTPGNGQFSRTGRRALPGQLRAAHARTGHNRDPGAAPPAFFPNQPQFPKGVPKFFRVLTASRIFPVPDRASTTCLVRPCRGANAGFDRKELKAISNSIDSLSAPQRRRRHCPGETGNRPAFRSVRRAHFGVPLRRGCHSTTGYNRDTACRLIS